MTGTTPIAVGIILLAAVGLAFLSLGETAADADGVYGETTVTFDVDKDLAPTCHVKFDVVLGNADRVVVEADMARKVITQDGSHAVGPRTKGSDVRAYAIRFGGETQMLFEGTLTDACEVEKA